MKSIGIVINPAKPLSRKLLPELINWITSKGINVSVVKEKDIDFIDETLLIEPNKLQELSQFVIAMGGDGTILRAARYIKDSGIPLIGINLGSLGFLTEVVIEELYPTMEKIIAGDYNIEKRSVIKAVLPEGRKFFALNDIVLHMGHSGRIMGIEILVDGSPLAEFSADGLIISTPTGSTAYSLAAAGPILYPGLKSKIVTPICPHTLALRPMVFSEEQEILVRLKKGEGIFVVDGQMIIAVRKDFSFTVTKADYEVNLVRATTRDFYQILRTKLKWGGI